MNKKTFLSELRKRLRGASKKEVDECLSFYGEMIDDGIEEGLIEEEAVKNVGSIDKIVASFRKNANASEKGKRERLSGGTVALLIIGSPLWISLLLAAAAVLISLFAAFWSLIVAVWSVFLALAGCGVLGIVCSFIFAFINGPTLGFALLGVGMLSGGLGIFLFYGCLAATKGAAIVTKKTAVAIANIFAKKEDRA